MSCCSRSRVIAICSTVPLAAETGLPPPPPEPPPAAADGSRNDGTAMCELPAVLGGPTAQNNRQHHHPQHYQQQQQQSYAVTENNAVKHSSVVGTKTSHKITFNHTSSIKQTLKTDLA